MRDAEKIAVLTILLISAAIIILISNKTNRDKIKVLNSDIQHLNNLLDEKDLQIERMEQGQNGQLPMCYMD